MTRRKPWTLAIVAAGLAVSASGFAAGNNTTHTTKSQALFKQLDANHDGKLTAAEMAKLPAIMRNKRLARIDTNGNGKVSKNEYLAWQKKRAERRFARLDSDHDGVLTADELSAHSGHHKTKSKAKQASAKKHSHKRRHHARRGHHRWHHHMRGTSAMFARLDANNDGYVSQQEWNTAAEKWHARRHAWHKSHK